MEIPTLAEVNPSVVTPASVVDSSIDDQRTRRRRLGGIVAVGSAALLLVAAVGALLWVRTPAPAPLPTEVPAAPPVSQSALAPSTAVPEVAPPTLVTLHIESTPEHADVSIDGKQHGQTPVEVQVPRGEQPVRLELQLHGYQPLVEEAVPDVDQRLRLVLQPKPSARPTSKPTSTGPSYRRFD